MRYGADERRAWRGEQILAQPATLLARLERREVLAGPWPYTDDTVMAMSIVESLLAQDTVPFALWCARHFMSDYADALWTAVSRFGDCDTLAAIVGSIVALHYRPAG